MMTQRNDEFLARSRELLDASTEQLDESTLTALRRARQRALDAHAQRTAAWRGWMPLALPAVAASLLVSVVVVSIWDVPDNGALTASLEDINLLTANEELEFYEELDFYSWLEYSEQD